jgi:antirestriction protein ArdC
MDNQITEQRARREFEAMSGADGPRTKAITRRAEPGEGSGGRQKRQNIGERCNNSVGKAERRSYARGSRGDIYEDVTAKIVAELEAGRFPWVQPWASVSEAGGLGAGMPKNAATGAAYSGINILLLWGEAFDRGFPVQSWLTYKQAKSLGGSVQRGERGTTIVYADKFIPKGEKERVKTEGGEASLVPFLKRYTVFNASQCEGLPATAMIGGLPLPTVETIPRAECLINATGADFRIGGDKAFYAPSRDFIKVPPQAAFFEDINYYRTCFHELGHWTGHASRLQREFKGRYGSQPYAREELVAELSSAFVCASLNIKPTIRHADYLGSWLQVLKEDNRAIFNAASLASKAADFLLAFEHKPPPQDFKPAADGSTGGVTKE